MDDRLTPQERQSALETLWNGLEDILFDEDEDRELILAEDYYIWEKGTPRTEIWHWFDERFTNGIQEYIGC